MAFHQFISDPRASLLLDHLHKKFTESRSLHLRNRSDRMRSARSGWRPTAPLETKKIRTAKWEVDPSMGLKSKPSEKEQNVDFSGRFIPYETNFLEISNLLSWSGEGVPSSVRVRGLEILEPRFIVNSRPAFASFFDLVFALSKNPRAVISIPLIESYLEARFWAEVIREVEASFEIPKHSMRIEIGIESLGGLAEADEIIFELKEFAERIRFDPRLVLFDELKLDSASPAPIYEGDRTNEYTERLQMLAERRGLKFSCISQKNDFLLHPKFNLEELRAQTHFSFSFLRSWFSGDLSQIDGSWEDFELSRAWIWTAIHTKVLPVEVYTSWKIEFGKQPFMCGSPEDAAIRTLDPLLETAVFPEYSLQTAFTTLIDLEKSRSVTSSRSA